MGGRGFRWGGGGVQFSQTILSWLKQIHISLKRRRKIHFGGSLSATKCYPYNARPRNLSAISPIRNVGWMFAHMPLHTADIWKKYINLFYFLQAFLSLNRDKYFALYWRFCVRISFILLLIKWSEMDPNVKPQTLAENLTKPTPILSWSICHGSHNFVDLSSVNKHSWA